MLEPASLALAPGDTLVLYTDGVTDARDPAGERFGEERLHAALAGGRGRRRGGGRGRARRDRGGVRGGQPRRPRDRRAARQPRERLARRGHRAEQRAEQQAVQPRAVDVAVLEPVEHGAVHEPQPAADGGAQRRAGRAARARSRRGSGRRSGRGRARPARAPRARRRRSGSASSTRRRCARPSPGTRRGWPRAARPAAGSPSGCVGSASSRGGLLERRREVRLLGREVVVEQRLRDPRLARDLRHRQLVVRVAGEQAGARARAAAGAARRRPGGCMRAGPSGTGLR